MYLCAMGLPGGGRSLPTMRLLRHFHLLHVPELSRPTMKRIFTKILEWGMTRHNQSWKRQITTITDITIDCYQRTVKTLLPTPAKSHYVFNLRQVSEIIQGILFVDYMTVEKQQDKLSMLKRLWLHECMRVFSDRLTNDKDRKLFISECLNNKEDQSFIDFEKLGNPEDITFCNFVKFVPGEETFYEESQNTIDLRQTLGDVLQRYNDSRAPKDKMNILFFEYMIQHLSRASRIIMKPQGNGLLIGLTGNGRRSVSKLAIFLNACSQFSIDLHKNYGLNEWQEDLRNFFKTLGIDNKLTVFVFSDKDIKEEIFFEDIDSMLNVGELNNLFNSEDLEEIQYEIEKQLKRTRGVKRTPMEVFKKRCKKNFHLLLLMSPAGNKLQLYFRKYPSLVNCTSIDWYLAWPDAALLTVSEQYLIPVHNVIYESQQYEKDADPKKKADGKKLTAIPEDEENPISDRNSVDLNSDQKPSEKDDLEEFLDVEQERIKKMSVNERVSAIMTMIHQKQIELASEFQSVKRKHVYVTPLMFAGMFKTLQKLLDRKNKAIEEERGKYTQGILKLEEAKVMIDEMQMQLEKLKPVLESKKKQVDATMKRLEQESRKVEATEQIVKKEEAEVKEQRDEADSIKNDCQARLAIAEPHFTAAINALRCLSQNDFTVIKSFTNPPAGVRLALEACCVMLGLKGQAVRIDNKKVIDFWDVSKKAVTNYKKLIDQLENYPKEDVSPEIIKKIQPYLSNPDFQPEKIKQASEAAEGICKWVIAICKFDIVYKEITPKRIALEQANEKLKIVSQKLADKQAELQIIIDQKTQLELEFKQQNQEKEDLLFQRDQAQKKLDRASKLISSIGSERDRWVSTKAKLGEAKRSLLGDMVIASAIISYLGPFDGKYRSIAVREMGMLCRKYNIEFSYNYSLKGVIANEEEVTDWLIKGLPNEQVCVDNMIIVSECKETHYPVLIDPQGQALKFLQQFTQTGEPVVQMKITQPNAAYLLQHALQEGFKVIVENASEVTNTSLLSILRRETQTSVGTSLMIKFNDQQIEFDRHFYCYILSQYTTPHFQPEVQQLSKVLDFSVTREGLEQQLLQIVCKSESAKEEDEREKLTKQGLLFTQQKKQIVNDILDTLRNSGKNILESDDLVNKLESSKQLTNEINHKLNVARHIEERIEENRKIFKPVAEHGARLYFAVQDLPLLDPMYQFSMKWFKDLFDSCFVIEGEEKKEEEKAEEHSFNDDVTPPTRTKKALNKQRGRQEPVKTKEMKMQRVIQLKKDFREILYKNVCMSLFETHKLLFAFYMSLKIFEQGEQAESFAEKLKALDKLNEESAKLYDSSSKQSDDLVNMKASTIKKNTESRRGGSRVGMDERVLIPKEDEKLKINEDLLNFTLTGLLPRGMKIYGSDKNPDPSVFSEKMWKELEVLTAFDCFESLQEEITKNLPAWRQFIAADQESVFDLLPEPYHSQLTYFALIPLMRILRPELTTATIRRYVQSSLGQFFVQPIIFQVNDIVEQSKVYTPMLLLLTPGNDPMEAIKKAAEERGKVPNPISLGKGQGDKAKRVIQESKKYESWIVLQNCHLAASFLPDLEQIIENLQPQKNKANMPDQQMSGGKKEKEEAPPHPGFRIWLTSMSIDYFPQSILYNSIKITSEPPKGIKAAMLRQYGMIASNKAEKQTYEANQQPEKWRTLFLSLSFFHAVVRERRRFGPLGWTKLYDFNDSDFRISMRQLYIMVEEFEEVPFTALQYLTGDCNYGGRVTDDRDRIALTAILKDFYTEKTYKTESYAFAGEQNAKYKIFNAPTIKEYLDYINSLPDDESPELMGLHENANISQAIYEASQIFANVLKLGQTSNAEGTSSNQEQCRTMTLEILDKIREPFKIKEVEAIYPFRYEESMNSVLLQELARFNKLIEIIKGSLQTLLKTLDGKFVTTAEIEALKASILSNVIPERWKKASYQSRKPLLSYVTDLQQRLEMLEHWIKNGKPNVFWISGFFFTQSFLTGIKQNFARRFNHPIDLVEFRFEILKYADAKKAENEPPQFGCFLQGLFLEGASWEDMHGCLEESKRGEMFVSMPIINFVPKLVAPSQTQEQLPCDTNGSTHGFHYACPTYKTGERYGTLLTTGHSTNYVMNISLPSKVEPEHWVKRSVALLMQLDT